MGVSAFILLSSLSFKFELSFHHHDNLLAEIITYCLGTVNYAWPTYTHPKRQRIRQLCCT